MNRGIRRISKIEYVGNYFLVGIVSLGVVGTIGLYYELKKLKENSSNVSVYFEKLKEEDRQRKTIEIEKIQSLKNDTIKE